MDRADLAKALKTLAKSLKRKQYVEVLLSFDGSLLHFDCSHVSVMTAAQGTWPGRCRVIHRFLMGFVDALPAGDPIPFRVEGGSQLWIGRTRTNCVWIPEGYPEATAVPHRTAADLNLLDLLDLPKHYTDTELNDRGILGMVLEARRERTERLRQAALLLGPLGIERAQLDALVSGVNFDGRVRPTPKDR